ncbi:hypothetical protein [Candidatus Nitrospira allomarina]|uniref:Uncharacterized protein n=1 Tax=Candidatus Nitrospira allomarina TaxID=3020900 RepID=A0AA96GBM7_9BACT|nr:hypothetical protein [Candidatus Nitrospira allomarina]WNM58808.1 hypothetical protein PP769_03295 [Candidatus Nitrospira allomarina]
MPQENNFQHANYLKSDPRVRVGYRTFQPGTVDSPSWSQGMSSVGEQMAQSQVKGILFLNGLPFMDLFGAARLDEVGGLKRGYSRGISGLESLLALLRPTTNGICLPDDPIHPPVANDEPTYGTVDLLAQGAGNFSSSYVGKFELALSQGSGQSIPCRRYLWSSINHHVGRVEAAMHLLMYLRNWVSRLDLTKDDRLLIVGHGHAGQVLALLSNILAPGESEMRGRVFEILANYWQGIPSVDRSVEQLESLYGLVMDQTALRGATVDVVTLGTPVRYGWDTDGIGHLLHFVNHREIRTDGKRWLAKMELPQIAWEMPYQTGGDYVQQLAVAGTDMVPNNPESEQANVDFREIFEPYDGFERWLECTRRGTRCANDGQCLLVEYGVQAEESPRQHLFGHACYTQSRAMLFLATEIAQAFYSPKSH